MRRRLGTAALVALIGIACWWAFRSESTQETPAPDASKPADARDVEVRREEAARRTAERAARKERENEEANAASESAPTLVVRVVLKEKGDAVAGARVVVRGENLKVLKSTTNAEGVARFDDFTDDYARIDATASGMTRGFVFAAKSEFRSGASVIVEVEPGVSLDGVVRDESDGRGIADAHVEIPGRDGKLAEADTAADGSFRLDGVPASGLVGSTRNAWSVNVIATAPRYIAKVVKWTPADGPHIEIRMGTAGLLRGRVVEPDGAPAQWATVTARPSEQNPSVGWMHAQTDADGRYELNAIPLGHTWRVSASKPTFVDSATVDDVVLEPGRKEAVLDFALLRAAHFVVRVFRPNGSPGAGAKLRLDVPGAVVERTADASGACDIAVVSLGACVLAVEDWGFAAATLDVDAESGVRRDVDVHLQPGATLAGVVVDDAGEPIADAVLVARAAGDGPANHWTHHDLSEKDGSFRISGLAAGDVVVDVSCSEGHDALSRVPATAPAADVRFVLRRDGGVSFRLRAPTGASPPKQIAVSLIPRGRGDASSLRISQQNVPWSDDLVRVSSGVGAWTCMIHVAGYLPVRRDVDVAPGVDASLGEIVLDEGLALSGRVVDAEGRPVKGAVVSINYGRGPVDPDAPGGSVRHYVDARGAFVDVGGAGGPVVGASDANGSFRLEHLVAAQSSFIATAPGYLATTVSCDVAPGAAPIVITLRRGDLLRCAVRFADGKPASDVTVDASCDESGAGAPTSYRLIGAAGVYSQRVPDGRAHVVVRRGETTLATKDVDVREGVDASVEITLEK
jgi:hypothetical protein